MIQIDGMESIKKFKCKHTINCWHKTHKFKRKLNYVTQQLNSVWLSSSPFVLESCRDCWCGSVERFSSVSRNLSQVSERREWDKLEWARMMEVLINVLHFSFANLLRLPSQWKFLHSHDSSHSTRFFFIVEKRHKTDCELVNVVCVRGFRSDKKIKEQKRRMRGDEKKNGWGCERLCRSLVIVINWLYLLFTTSKLNHKNWGENGKKCLRLFWEQLEREECADHRSHSHFGSEAFEFPSQFYFLILIWISGWGEWVSMSSKSIARMLKWEGGSFIRSTRELQGHEKIDKVVLRSFEEEREKLRQEERKFLISSSRCVVFPSSKLNCCRQKIQMM